LQRPAVVAQEVSIHITLAEGTGHAAAGRDGEISGQDVYVSLNQIYARQEKIRHA